MGWRDNLWFQWFPVVLVLSVVTLCVVAVSWSHFAPPCKRSVSRFVEVSETKYTRGGVRRYEVCLER